MIGSSEVVSTLVIYIPEVFFADRKLPADFGTVVIYPTSQVRGFPNKHRAPEYEFTASSTLQTFAYPQFKLFLYSSAKQIYVNMPFHFLFRNSYYSFNIHGSPQINVYVALWVHYSPPAEPPTQTTGKSCATFLAFIDNHRSKKRRSFSNSGKL